MKIFDSFQLAYRTVKSNKLRSGITIAIIAFGIMALVGIITAIDAMNKSLKESFSFMGSNTFTLRYKEIKMNFGGNSDVKKTVRGKEKKSNLNKVIRKEDAEYFKDNYKYPNAVVSIYRRGGNQIDCTYGDKKTNPITTIIGGDENYLSVTGYSITEGRNLNNLDINSGRNVCLLGSKTAQKLFGENAEKCLDKIIRVAGIPYRVIGLLKDKGAGAFLRQDDVVITSYTNASRLSTANPTFIVGVMVGNVLDMEAANNEATAVFRGVRKLTPTDADNFVVEKSDKMAEMVIGFLSTFAGSAAIIGMITLVGAAIGLMNIMLVAVNERTREVGLIKAIGGKSKNVRHQFLFESLIISLFGAAWGIFLGILVGNIVAIFLKTGLVIPWFWVFAGIIICTIVGLGAGLYPAYKASKLNPITALRYE